MGSNHKNELRFRGEVKDKIKHQVNDEIPDKVFKARESILTELLKTRHFVALHQAFVAVFLIIFLKSVLYDYFYNEKINAGFGTIVNNFRNLHMFIVVWICGFLITLCVYYGFRYWAKIRIKLRLNPFTRYLWDKLWITVFLMYMANILYFLVRATHKYNFGFALSLAAGGEATRFLMKAYAFLRSNTPRIVKHYELKNYPLFSQYLYFLFAPTLIYRDCYPRSKDKIRWHLVGTYLAEIICAIIFSSLLYDNSHLNKLQEYGLRPYTKAEITMMVFNNSLHSMMGMILIFYIIFHLWLNACAEVLRFSDRSFYGEWWTSTSYSTYFRTWSGPVHDWLYTYVYKDVCETIFPGNKIVGRIVVFFISTIFHEYILANAIGFYIPIHLVHLFLLSSVMYYLKFSKKFLGNVFFWYSMSSGTSSMLAVIAMEYYCRLNYVKNDLQLSVYNLFTPKLLQCKLV